MNRTDSYPKAAVHKREGGAALLIALVILLATTLIGVTIARTTTLQERMAGNLRQDSIAFEGAEAMLREGEAWLDAQTDKPDAVAPDNCGSPPCDVLNDAPGATDGDPLQPLSAGTWSGNDVRDGGNLFATNTTQFYIEERQVISGGSLVIGDGKVDRQLVYYAVVGRATTETGPEAILRSHYVVPFSD